MFTGNEDMEATALRQQGWSISAIARHLDRDRKTVRAHLNGERVAGVRRRSRARSLRGVRPLSAGAIRRRCPPIGQRALRRGGGIALGPYGPMVSGWLAPGNTTPWQIGIAARRGATLSEVSQECVLGILGLLEGILDGGAFTRLGVDREPPTVDHLDPLSPLDLEDDQTMPRVEEDEIRFTVALTTVTFGLPSHRVEHPPFVIELGEGLANRQLGGVVIGWFLGKEARHACQIYPR